MIRSQQPHQRGAALLMVLVAMATAMTLVVGWLGSQDNSALIASNATRAASARATAQSGLEIAVAILQSEAPWQTSHQDGWILQGYELGTSTIDLRLIDEATGFPPDGSTTVVRIESTANTNSMVQTASALATIHPFDEDSMADISGYAVFGSGSISISGATRIKSWIGSGRGERILASLGETSFSGRAKRDLQSGDLALHIDDTSAWGSTHDFDSANLPTVLGPLGLDLVELPQLPARVDIPNNGDNSTGRAAHRNWSSGLNGVADLDGFGNGGWHNSFGDDELTGTVLEPFESMEVHEDFNAKGDLHLSRNAVLTVEGETAIFINGNFTMEPGSIIELSDTATLTIVVGGDMDIDRAVIGGPQSNPPWWGVWKAQHIDWIDPQRIRIVSAANASPADWAISNQSMVQAVLEAPTANIELDRSTVLGRVAGVDITIRRGARLFFDHQTTRGRGLKALTEVIDRMDLMNLHPGGVDPAGCDDMLARLSDLLDRPCDSDTPMFPPIDGWWMHRPFPVDSTMTRCGGDVTRWEQAAIASADAQGRFNP